MLTPLRVAVLTSRRAPGLSWLLEEDPLRGRRYDLVVGLSSDAGSEELPRLRAAGIPALSHDLGTFCAARGGKRGDLTLRRDYDARAIPFLKGYGPDLIVLCGYLHIVSEPLLAAFPGRVINLHDADLTEKGGDGLPRFRGLHSTYDALAAGRTETRSTVHLVTAEVDQGPPLVRSWGFPSHPLVQDARRWGADRILKAYAYAQREWMMRAAWGPLMARAIGLFALDQVRLLNGRVVIAGRRGPVQLDPEPLPMPRLAEA
ncbi:MAG TPA: formyltransferase family protein [Gemmatimonadales bacterium]|jgi:phosphoribosylglycinamide formyltransferase 1